MHDDNPWAKEYEENAPRTRRSDITGMTWKQGDNTIRILPNPKGGLPFVKYTVHWIPMKTSKNNRPIIHDVKFKCPVCEFVGSLWSEVYRLKEEEGMTDKDPEIQKLLKQIGVFRGKKTYDMNVIHREDYRADDSKIKIKRLVAGPTIWKPIIELGNSSKWGNPSTASAKGYDLTITVDGEKLKREYTVLPDSERKALTDEEMTAVKERAYDLAKLRVFSSPTEMLDVIENSKPPLDGISLKKLRKLIKGDDEEETSTVGHVNEEDTQERATDTDDDDDDTTPATATASIAKAPAPAKATPDDDDDKDVPDPDDDDDDDKTKKEVAESKKDSKAFTEANEPAAESDDATVTLNNMDCRGTYDPEDIGCQDCSLANECQELKKEKEKAAVPKTMGKQGKAGKQTETTPDAKPVDSPKRKLPF